MSTLPGQDPALSNLPSQQPFLGGQQPMYQPMPVGAGQQQPQQQQQAPHGQQGGGRSEAQLISFD
ncbi:hypothetical protein FKM82_028931 [Ascaphus truei]